MKDIPFIFMLAALGALPAKSYAQSTPATTASVPAITGISAVDEANLIAQIHAAASGGTNGTVDSLLVGPSFLPDSKVPSITLARRAMGVCAWLLSDNNRGAALSLASDALSQLSSLTEANATDHEERLYWEAQLNGRILDKKVAAIALLEKARAINGNDQRVLQLDLEFASAVAAFGR